MEKSLELSTLKAHDPDFPTICEWQFHEWAHLHDNHTMEKRVQLLLDSALQKKEREIPCTWIVKVDGEVAGTMALIYDDLPTRPELNPWFASLYVHPRFRKRGIGSYLCQYAEKQAQDWGYKKLYLYTPDQEALYRSLGWETIERTRYKGEEIVIMEKIIST